MRGIQIRDELTDEWKKRGVDQPQEFSILTAEICKATFGVTPSEYKQHKALKRENLRDHMTERGGSVAGKARKDLESKTGKNIVTKENYLDQNSKQLEKSEN